MSGDASAPEGARAIGWGYARLARWLAHPRATPLFALLAVAMSLPALSLGLVGDDLVLADALEDDAFAAYVFQPLDPGARRASIASARYAGTLPWWIADDFHQAFMRPLASLSLALDFRLFAGAPWVMHLENTLLFGAIVLVVSALYRRLGLASPTLGFATLFFALNAGQAMTTGFIAGRNTLLAALFGLLSLWIDHRASTSAGRTRVALQLAAALALACALLSGEFGACALGYLVSAACLLDPRPPRARLLRLLPYLLVVCAWQLAYRLGGYGVRTSSFYSDPAADPIAYVLSLVTGAPIYLASVLTVPFAGLAGFTRHARLLLALLSVGVLLLARALLSPLLRADVRARYFALGALLSTLPLGAALPQDRLVFFVSFGLSALIAWVVAERFDPQNVALPRAGARRLYRMHTLYAIPLYYFYLFATMNNGFGSGARALAAALPRAPAPSVLLLNAPTSFPTIFAPLVRAREGTSPTPPIDLLYAVGAPLTIRRITARTLELQVERGMFASPMECATRDPSLRAMHAGEVVELGRMHVAVLAVNERGAPTRVRFELAPSLPLPMLMTWVGEVVSERPWPNIGEQIELPALSLL